MNEHDAARMLRLITGYAFRLNEFGGAYPFQCSGIIYTERGEEWFYARYNHDVFGATITNKERTQPRLTKNIFSATGGTHDGELPLSIFWSLIRATFREWRNGTVK